jgi:hypothetical protein
MPQLKRHWSLVTWQAPALLGLGMAAAWVTQAGWVTLLGLAGYLLVLLFDTLGSAHKPTGREAAARGAGVAAVVAAATITTFLRPFPFPFNFLISLGLGAALQFGTLNMLGPGPAMDVIEGQMTAEYRTMLSALQAVAAHTLAASRRPELPPATAAQLVEIAAVMGLIVSRYVERPADFAGAAATLTIFEQFHKILAYYLKIKSGEQFMDEAAKRKETTQTEGRTLPIFHTALTNLGKQLDANEVLDKGIAEEALESMLRSLNLMDDLNARLGAAPASGDASERAPF